MGVNKFFRNFFPIHRLSHLIFEVTLPSNPRCLKTLRVLLLLGIHPDPFQTPFRKTHYIYPPVTHCSALLIHNGTSLRDCIKKLSSKTVHDEPPYLRVFLEGHSCNKQCFYYYMLYAPKTRFLRLFSKENHEKHAFLRRKLIFLAVFYLDSAGLICLFGRFPSDYRGA